MRLEKSLVAVADRPPEDWGLLVRESWLWSAAASLVTGIRRVGFGDHPRDLRPRRRDDCASAELQKNLHAGMISPDASGGDELRLRLGVSLDLFVESDVGMSDPSPHAVAVLELRRDTFFPQAVLLF